MGTFVGYRDGGKTDEQGLFRWLAKLFNPGYAVGWSVTQRGAGANMSVDVPVGDGSLLRPAGDYSYYGWNDTVQNVVIAAADPTNPRRDIVVAYVDVSVVSSASADNPGALKFIAVAGTAAGSPVDPSNATIQAAVGASNPYTKLARVRVSAAAGSITNSFIDDIRTPMSLAISRLWGGASNTIGHLVPNVADDTVALLVAAQTLVAKTLTSPVLNTPSVTVYDGWITASGAWTFVSATTMTVPAADAAAMAVGDRIKLTQTTVKYFYVVGISGTTITITGGSDYTLVSAAITNAFYSHDASPVGFPQWFNYTPTFTGFSANPTVVARFTLNGRLCTVRHWVTGAGTSNTTGFTTTLPITSANQNVQPMNLLLAVDNAAATTANAEVTANSTSLTLFKGASEVAASWTASSSKYANFTISYEI